MGNLRAFSAGSGGFGDNLRAVLVKSACFTLDSAVFAVSPEKPQILSLVLRFCSVQYTPGIITQIVVGSNRSYGFMEWRLVPTSLENKAGYVRQFILDGSQGPFGAHKYSRRKGCFTDRCGETSSGVG